MVFAGPLKAIALRLRADAGMRQLFRSMDQVARPPLRIRGLGRFKLLLFFLPTVMVAIYYCFIAADQYTSEGHFVVRSAARPEGASFSPMMVLVQLGLSRTQDDSFIVQDFMKSRDAIHRLEAQMPLRAMFGKAQGDFIAKYPSLLYGRTEEEFYLYVKHMISVVHNDRAGISVLAVKAFDPADANQIAVALMRLSEDLVNRINDRIVRDAVSTGAANLEKAQQRLVEAQMTLTKFRNRELMIDPVRNAVSLGELIATLSSELAVTEAQIREMKQAAMASPQLIALKRKAEAIEAQIAQERSRVAGDSSGLADRIAEYERLNLEKVFASRLLSTAEADLSKSRAEATRQLLYLERVVEPHLPDYPTQPRRVASIVTTACVNILAYFMIWLFLTGVREHAA
jgi:capsular polysaccharide transport system permease protein